MFDSSSLTVFSGGLKRRRLPAASGLTGAQVVQPGAHHVASGAGQAIAQASGRGAQCDDVDAGVGEFAGVANQPLFDVGVLASR